VKTAKKSLLEEAVVRGMVEFVDAETEELCAAMGH